MRRVPTLIAFVVVAAFGCKAAPQRAEVEWGPEGEKRLAAAQNAPVSPGETLPPTNAGGRIRANADAAKAAVPDVAVAVVADAGESWFSEYVASRYGAGVGALLTALLAVVKFLRR